MARVRSDRPGHYLPPRLVSTTNSHSRWTDKRGPVKEAVAFAVHAPEGSVPLSPEWSTTVTGEEDHQDVLRELAPAGTGPERWETATLGFCTIAKGKYAGQQAIEVRLGGRRVGQLTRAMSERYEKLVRDALDAGKTPICLVSLLSTRDKGVQVQLMMPAVKQ